MLKVAICDDNALLCTQLETALAQVQQTLEEKMTIDTYYDTQRLARAIQDGKIYDLLFLDIEMPGQSGLELARQIRGEWHDHLTQIAIVTANSQYMPELFDIQPIDYLPKPPSQEQIAQAVQITLRLQKKRAAFFEYPNGREIHRLPTQEILCLAVFGKLVTIITTDGSAITYRGTLAQALEQLSPHGFIRLNQSEAVNLAHVASYSRTHVRLRDGHQFTISQRYQAEALRRLRGGDTQ